jgi:hypothetical protein
MSFFRRGIADIRQEGQEDTFRANQHIDRLEKHFDKQKDMFKAILDQLPPASGAPSFAPRGGHQ